MSVVEVESEDIKNLANAALAYAAMMRFSRRMSEGELRPIEESCMRLRRAIGYADDEEGMDLLRSKIDGLRRGL